ncbi:MAG: DUF308 domain-containing protein [Eubacteriales bacterium]|nr:DUF308 domain-containing protein [Eubacteriales bacterium]
MGKKLSKILKGQAASSAFYILFGLCLVLMPEKMVGIICKVIFGLVLIGAGCYHIYIYVREKEKATMLDLFSGVIVLVIGGFLFYTPQVVMKLLQYLLGAFVLVDSIWSIQGSLKLKKRGKEQWKILFFGSLIFVVMGIAIMVNPFSQVRNTVIFAGWVFLCNGAADVAFLIYLRKGMKEITEPEETQEHKDQVQAVRPEHEEWQDSWKDENKGSEPVSEVSEGYENEDEIMDGSWHQEEREDSSIVPEEKAAGEVSDEKPEEVNAPEEAEIIEEWKD